MMTVLEFHLVPAGIALLIGFATGWWIFRRPKK